MPNLRITADIPNEIIANLYCFAMINKYKDIIPKAKPEAIIANWKLLK